MLMITVSQLYFCGETIHLQEIEFLQLGNPVLNFTRIEGKQFLNGDARSPPVTQGDIHEAPLAMIIEQQMCRFPPLKLHKPWVILAGRARSSSIPLHTSSL